MAGFQFHILPCHGKITQFAPAVVESKQLFVEFLYIPIMIVSNQEGSL